MRDLYGIRESIQRIRNLMGSNEDRQLLYAALELRFVMESIAFRQLDQYAEEVRVRLAKEWNASRIVRMLAQLDETSDQTAEFSFATELLANTGQENVALQDLDFMAIGSANRVPWRRFHKAYNSLGSFLHLASDGNNRLPARETLIPIVDMLEHVADSSVIAALNHFVTANCTCGTLLVIGPRQVAGDEQIYCNNKSCKAVYMADKENPGSMNSVGQLLLKCPCGAKVLFHKESMLATERCDNCQSSVRVLINGTLNIVEEAY